MDSIKLNYSYAKSSADLLTQLQIMANANRSYDTIVLNQKMIADCEIDVIAHIRKITAYEQTPIVLLISADFASKSKEVKSLDVQEYLVKYCSSNMLFQTFLKTRPFKMPLINRAELRTMSNLGLEDTAMDPSAEKACDVKKCREDA